MIDPTLLLGRYFVPSPGVLSVFAVAGGRRARLVRRDWPFIVTKVSATGLEAQNTTGHCLTLSLDEIRGCTGSLDGPPRYLEPLVIHLNSQIYWDASDLWKVPLGTDHSRLAA